MKGSEAQVFNGFSISYGGDEVSLNSPFLPFYMYCSKTVGWMDGVLVKLPQFTGKGYKNAQI